jgi:hypothetical protein
MRYDQKRNRDAGVQGEQGRYRRPASIKPNIVASSITVSPVATGTPFS